MTAQPLREDGAPGDRVPRAGGDRFVVSWLPVDVDRQKTSEEDKKRGATQEELSTLHAVATEVREHMEGQWGWPVATIVMSGNGYHLWVPLAEGWTDVMVSDVLKDLHRRFGGARDGLTVEIDPHLAAPNQAIRIPNTFNQKIPPGMNSGRRCTVIHATPGLPASVPVESFRKALPGLDGHAAGGETVQLKTWQEQRKSVHCSSHALGIDEKKWSGQDNLMSTLLRMAQKPGGSPAALLALWTWHEKVDFATHPLIGAAGVDRWRAWTYVASALVAAGATRAAVHTFFSTTQAKYDQTITDQQLKTLMKKRLSPPRLETFDRWLPKVAEVVGLWGARNGRRLRHAAAAMVNMGSGLKRLRHGSRCGRFMFTDPTHWINMAGEVALQIAGVPHIERSTILSNGSSGNDVDTGYGHSFLPRHFTTPHDPLRGYLRAQRTAVRWTSLIIAHREFNGPVAYLHRVIFPNPGHVCEEDWVTWKKEAKKYAEKNKLVPDGVVLSGLSKEPTAKGRPFLWFITLTDKPPPPTVSPPPVPGALHGAMVDMDPLPADPLGVADVIAQLAYPLATLAALHVTDGPGGVRWGGVRVHVSDFAEWRAFDEARRGSGGTIYPCGVFHHNQRDKFYSDLVAMGLPPIAAGEIRFTAMSESARDRHVDEILAWVDELLVMAPDDIAAESAPVKWIAGKRTRRMTRDKAYDLEELDDHEVDRMEGGGEHDVVHPLYNLDGLLVDVGDPIEVEDFYAKYVSGGVRAKSWLDAYRESPILTYDMRVLGWVARWRRKRGIPPP